MLTPKDLKYFSEVTEEKIRILNFNVKIVKRTLLYTKNEF